MASITFHQDPDLVGKTISLPPKTFQSAKELFKSVLVQPGLVYLITLDFIGFRVPEATTEIPSIEEFLAGPLDGKVYMSENVSILIKRISQDA